MELYSSSRTEVEALEPWIQWRRQLSLPQFNLDVAACGRSRRPLMEGHLGSVEEDQHGNNKLARVKKSRFEGG